MLRFKYEYSGTIRVLQVQLGTKTKNWLGVIGDNLNLSWV